MGVSKVLHFRRMLLFNYFKNFPGSQEFEIERVLLGLPIMLSFREFFSKLLTPYVAWRVHLGTDSR